MREPTIHVAAVPSDIVTSTVHVAAPLCRPDEEANVINAAESANCKRCAAAVERLSAGRTVRRHPFVTCRKCGLSYVKRSPDSVCPDCYR